MRLSDGGLGMAIPFDFYAVTHFSEHPSIDAQITCFATGGAIVGILNFIKDGTTLPANVGSSPPVINFPVRQFNDVVTTLRYEKPLVFNLNIGNKIGTVGTAREPVGEQEAV
jgi:hypothetical protein